MAVAERPAVVRPWVEPRLIFADAAWGRLGVAEHGFSYPADRVLPEGRFSQMRRREGWAWPNEPHSSDRGSNRG